MSFYLNSHALERIRKNGTLITPLTCCGFIIQREDRRCDLCRKQVFVILHGLRNQIRQTYKWGIYIGKPTGKPIATLTCASCNQTVNTENQQCACGAYCHLEFVQENGQLQLHRNVSMDPTPTCDGIHIVTEDVEPNRPIHAQPLSLPTFDPKVGGLYCPFGHPYSYIGMPNIDEEAKCTGHHVKLSAVLVRTDEGIMIERRAIDLATGNPREIDEEKRHIAQLYCPACAMPIVEKTLLCSTCKTYIVDVVQKPPIQMNRPSGFGTDIHIFIEIKPRWAWDTKRPKNALIMEGNNWANPQIDTQTKTTPIQSTPIQSTQHPQTEYDIIFAEYIRLQTLGYTMRAAAAKIGISVGKLQYILKKKKEEIETSQKYKRRK